MAGSSAKLSRQVTEAAVRLFKQRGYEQVSVNDICQEAGIARSTFYRLYRDKKDIIRALLEHTKDNQVFSMEAAIVAKNDFERMWAIADGYLSVVKELGPELVGTWLRLDLCGEVDASSLVHSIDDWMVRLTQNCQRSGIVLNQEPAEILAPIGVSAMYMVTYEWCRQKGALPLRARARQITEAIFQVAEPYRWTDAQLAAAD